MNRDKLKALYLKYELTAEDIFTKDIGNSSFTIITRQGIDKIQGVEQIDIQYEAIKCESNFAVIKAKATKLYFDKGNDAEIKIETFGSALKGENYKDGNCNSWYVVEMAEKRAMSRAVLKLTGFYELGVFGEDEADNFKKPITIKKQ